MRKMAAQEGIKTNWTMDPGQMAALEERIKTERMMHQAQEVPQKEGLELKNREEETGPSPRVQGRTKIFWKMC
jgi:hypothetical protein